MYLVTGGAGFIGSHIVSRLLAMGERVRILDNFSFGSLENLGGAENQPEIVSGDVTDLAAARKAMAGVSVVFHQAALRSVPLSLENPSLVNQVNVQGTLNVLVAARDAGVKRVVYASSSSAYGNVETLPKKEDLTPSPASPYAVSKLAGEHYCKVFTELYRLETVSLRYFNVFGPRQDPNSQYAAVIPRFVCRALAGQPLEVHGDGLQSRDFTYVDNVVDANLLASESRDAVGGVFNVGQNGTITLLDVIDLLARILGRELSWIHAEPRAGDVRHSFADISSAGRVLNYRPRISFEEGLKRSVEYFRRKLGPAAAKTAEGGSTAAAQIGRESRSDA